MRGLLIALCASLALSGEAHAQFASGSFGAGNGFSAKKPSAGSSYTGPLDAVSGTASASAGPCYSLRACSASAASANAKAVNVCDAATNTTCLDITVLSSGDLDTATALAGPCASSCDIAKWYDQLGSGHDAPQSTNSARPVLSFSCQGTKACLTVNGSQGFNTTSFPTLAQAWTIASTAYRTSGGFSAIMGDSNPYGSYFYTSANTADTNAGTHLTATAADATWHALVSVANAASSVTNVDGTGTSGAAGSNSITGSSVQIFTGGFGNLTGKAEEVIAFSTGLSSGDQTAYCHNARLYYSGIGGSC